MVDIIDSTQQFTITLIAPEGFGEIQNLSYPTEANIGDIITVTFELVNTGGDDVLFARYTQVSPPGDTIEIWRGSLVSGGVQPLSFTFTMPPESLTYSIETGHEE